MPVAVATEPLTVKVMLPLGRGIGDLPGHQNVLIVLRGDGHGRSARGVHRGLAIRRPDARPRRLVVTGEDVGRRPAAPGSAGFGVRSAADGRRDEEAGADAGKSTEDGVWRLRGRSRFIVVLDGEWVDEDG